MRVRVRVRFLLFYSELTPTDPWCNMLRDFTWTEKYEEAMSGEHPWPEDRLEKIITKRKRKKNLKMPNFCAVYNCSNHADREKDKPDYGFP